MDLSITRTITNKIIDLHVGIQNSLRRTVKDAIVIGELFTKQKQILEHGEFLSWIDREMPFPRKTAYRYMKVYEYRNKIVTMTNLQEAYRQIETLERQKNLQNQDRKARLIRERKETGIRPEGWDRDVEYEYRKQEAFERQEKQEPETQPGFEDPLKKLFERIMYETKDEDSLDLDNLRSNAAQKGIFIVLEEYVQSFKTVSERLEAIHNLIKKLRLIAIQYQSDQKI